MHRNREAQWVARLLSVCAIALLPLGAAAQQQTAPAPQAPAVQSAPLPPATPRQTDPYAGLTPQQVDAAKRQEEGQAAAAKREVTQPLNNAPVWRDVRSGDLNPYQTTQVRGPETRVLIQSEGELWRRVRNGPVTVYGGWLMVAIFLTISLFYWWRGPIRLHEPRTGRVILRFTAWDRFVHWTTAITFVILAVSGIFMLFGRYVILPVFGYTLFSALTIVGKNLHNFVGPLFVVCTVLMFVTFARDNLPRAYDWLWLRKAGGMLTGEHVPSGKFNAGEKGWFWFGATVLGIVVSASGLVLDFPNFGQVRETMQVANIVHAIAAVVYMAISLGHIYLGTIGMEGAYDAMRHGTVDEAWAKEHHEYWYRAVAPRRDPPAAGMSAAASPASPLKEGWKL